MDGYLRLDWSPGQVAGFFTQADCDAIAARLNSRPRKRLGYKTPEECYARS